MYSWWRGQWFWTRDCLSRPWWRSEQRSNKTSVKRDWWVTAEQYPLCMFTYMIPRSLFVQLSQHFVSFLFFILLLCLVNAVLKKWHFIMEQPSKALARNETREWDEMNVENRPWLHTIAFIVIRSFFLKLFNLSGWSYSNPLFEHIIGVVEQWSAHCGSGALSGFLDLTQWL